MGDATQFPTKNVPRPIQPTKAELPYGIGRLSYGWGVTIVIGAALLLWGVIGYSRQFVEGEGVTGMRDWGTMGGSPWGLYIVFVVYFIGVSFAGITIAAMIRLFKLDHLKPVARIAELVTVITIMLGALSIVADLGEPLRGFVNLFRYARPQSPFFGTFTLVMSGYLFASLVYLFLDGRKDAAACAKTKTRLTGFHRLWASGYKDTPAERERHDRASFWLSITIIPLLITAHSTLGFVFGLQVGRPGWYSTLQAPAFVILAGVSGIGLLIVVAAIIRHAYGMQERLNDRVFRWLGLFMMGLVLAYLYFMLVEMLTMVYAGGPHEPDESLLFGQWSGLYWTSVVLLLLGAALVVWQAFRNRWSIPLLVVAGIAVNIAAVLKRYLLVVPSLTSGGFMPYEEGSYSPTWVEYSVIAGIIGLGILLFAAFAKMFPLLPVERTTSTPGRDDP